MFEWGGGSKRGAESAVLPPRDTNLPILIEMTAKYGIYYERVTSNKSQKVFLFYPSVIQLPPW